MNSETFWRRIRYSPFAGLGLGVAAIASATALMKVAAFEQYLYNVALVYIIIVLLIASRYGFLSGIVTSLLGFVCLDYFFIPPFYTFYIDSVAGVVGVIGFLVAAALTSRIASESRRRTVEAQERQREMAALNSFSTTMLTEPDDTGLYTRIVEQVAQMLSASSVLLYLPSLTDDSPLVVRASAPQTPPTISQYSLEMAQRAFIERHAVYDSLSERGYRACLPLLWGDTALGVLVVQVAADAQQRFSREFFDSDTQRWFQIVANQVALAVDHANYTHAPANTGNENRALRWLEDTPHDIDTPLAALQAAVERLRNPARTFSRQEQDIYLDIIEHRTTQIAQIMTDIRATRPGE